MKFNIEVDRTAAIAACNEAYGLQIVEVALSEIPADLRAEIQDAPEKEGVVDLTDLIDNCRRQDDPKPPVLSEASPQAVIEMLKYRSHVREHRRKRDAEKREEQILKALEAPEKHWIESNGSGEHRRAVVAPSPRFVPLDKEARADPRIKAVRDRVEREALSRAQAEFDEMAREAQRQREERAAGQQKLHEWAQANGSDRLRMMLDMQVGDWQAVAREEYQDAHAPDGFSRGTKGGERRRKPTLKELEVLRQLRDEVEASGGVLSDPTIDWVVEEADLNEYGEEIPERRYSVVEVQVSSPDGHYSWYSREIARISTGDDEG
ncbi:hypothetical protein [Thioalkalivibrio thiocyanodenitrificans]|uniref:hypothetical protein n=1 Tax=Thioalkalivibrio thiocyanodenitrificans TaxID=243063 RepID=UPI000524B6E7|nr:hypothetical protein [Thioalkalivibrio thiocyanodenitrificans]